MKFISVGIGGMVGAALRYGIGLWMNSGNSYLFPWETFVVNLTGAFSLAFLLFFPLTKEKVPPVILTGITTGVLGAYTTFSTLIVEITQLSNGHLILSMSYLLLSFFGGLACSFAGYKLARSLPAERRGTSS